MDVRERLNDLDARFRDAIEGYREDPQQFLLDHRSAGLLTLIVIFAYWIRSLPASGMQYLQALDPYMIARMSEAIVSSGSLPMVDVWRYFPYTTPTYLLNLGDIYIPAYLYTVLSPLTGTDFLTWAKLYPAIAGTLMVFMMYFVGKELFDERAGLLAAFFLAAAPAVLHRSSAGWYEKEPFAAFLMFTSIYFVTRAWKRESWISGIFSGVALGLALTVWGGTRFLVLLYPLVMFSVVLFDRDIEGIMAAFTPTILVGHILPATLNTWRWTVPNGAFIISVGILGVAWVRYLAGRFDLVSKKVLPFIPALLFLFGYAALFFSPLYSQPLANSVFGVSNQALQSGGDVVGGTVAENQPSTSGQIISQLGASQAAAVLPSFTSRLSGFFSGWTYSLIGMAAIIMAFISILIRRFYDMEEVHTYRTLLAFATTFAFLVTTILILLPGGSAGTLSVIAGFVLMAGLISLYLLPVEDGRNLFFSVSMVIMLSTVFSVLLFWNISITQALFSAGRVPQSAISFLSAISLVTLGLAILYAAPPEIKRGAGLGWYATIPLLWVGATLFGATQRSRLLFLTSHSVALMAGFGLSVAIGEIRSSPLWDRIKEAEAEITPGQAKNVGVLILVLFVVIFNAAAAFTMASSIGGSPNQAWMQNLQSMKNDIPSDSVVLSWWDYGYWFESIGSRAAIADGGNMGFYSQPGEGKINYPLADFLTSENYTEHLPWLESLSVDYIVLDASMIGKYSAVSQIHNRNNQNFNALQTFNCERSGNRCAISQVREQNYISYTSRGGRFLVPVRQSGNSISLAGTPVLSTQRGPVPVRNFCSSQGITPLNVSGATSSLDGCLSWHPYSSYSQVIYIPREAMGSTLVKLYVMDNPDMPHFNKVFDNGYVKMWSVDYDATS